MTATDSQPLPPFSGDAPRCVKCGNTAATTEYLATGRCMHDRNGLVIGLEPNERLHRQCTRCDYQWDEALASTHDLPAEPECGWRLGLCAGCPKCVPTANRGRADA